MRSQSPPIPLPLLVRRALASGDPGELLERWRLEPEAVAVALEAARPGCPDAVGRAWTALAGEPDPNGRAARGLARAVARHAAPGPGGGPRPVPPGLLARLVAAPVPVVARAAAEPGGPEVVALALALRSPGRGRALLRRLATRLPPPRHLVMAPLDWRFLAAAGDDRRLDIAWLEAPGRASVLRLDRDIDGSPLEAALLLGSEDEARRLVRGGGRSPTREPRDLPGCRAWVAGALAARGLDALPPGWAQLVGLVRTRLFRGDEGPGFVLGDAQARWFLDRLVGLVLHGAEVEPDEALPLAAPGSMAHALLDTWGPEVLGRLVGLPYGVADLEVVQRDVRGVGLVTLVGRGRGGEPLTRTLVEVGWSPDGWVMTRVALGELGPDGRILGPLWRSVTGAGMAAPRPDRLTRPGERRLLAAMVEDGAHLLELAEALALLRRSGASGEAAALAAAHALAACEGAAGPAMLHGADPEEVAAWMARLARPGEVLHLPRAQGRGS